MELQTASLTMGEQPKERIRIQKKLHSCNQCTYTSRWSSNLKSHMRVHCDVKPFACTQCNFSTKHATTLKTHMLFHSGEKSFTCDQCSFTSKWSQSLKNHMRSHSDVKPFACTQCNFSTKYEIALKGPDMKFVKKITPPDFQAKNFTPSISPNFNSFSKKKHKKLVKIEKFTPLAKILHCRRH